MQVQPYFPEPKVEVGCIAQQSYDARLLFIRRVLVGHAIVVGLITLVGWLWPWTGSAAVAAALAFGSLAILSALRGLARRSTLGRAVTLLAMVPVIVSLGTLAALWADLGLPVGACTVATAFGIVYLVACGRDYSHLGHFILAGASTLATFVVLVLVRRASVLEATAGAVLGLSFLAYVVYDLACLLQRRSGAEVLEAVADLFRDALNFTTYPIAVVRHWRTLRF